MPEKQETRSQNRRPAKLVETLRKKGCLNTVMTRYVKLPRISIKKIMRYQNESRAVVAAGVIFAMIIFILGVLVASRSVSASTRAHAPANTKNELQWTPQQPKPSAGIAVASTKKPLPQSRKAGRAPQVDKQ
jgi:H+/gluconate symporter-like permease